jgi:hypothetical protein
VWVCVEHGRAENLVSMHLEQRGHPLFGLRCGRSC